MCKKGPGRGFFVLAIGGGFLTMGSKSLEAINGLGVGGYRRGIRLVGNHAQISAMHTNHHDAH